MMDEYIIKYLPSHEDKLRKKVFEGSRYLKKSGGSGLFQVLGEEKN